MADFIERGDDASGIVLIVELVTHPGVYNGTIHAGKDCRNIEEAWAFAEAWFAEHQREITEGES
ncbi:hypothetical protein [Caldinitratiruptor microaerophilus]|uniref:hypothetical protein n=1 Tax=Caldinitratiruptor microaerophilus TaxID=671077 RepID=UPI0022309123|nr:hypothetical protein [Caldinitratiruptor microaerophilus]